MQSLKSPPHRLLTSLITSSRSALASASIPFTPTALSISSVLLRHGLLSNLSLGGPTGADPAAFHSAPAPGKRLWVGLKYRAGLPVLRRLQIVSKGSKRVQVTHQELGRLLTGRRARNVPGLGMGEILVLKEEAAGETSEAGQAVARSNGSSRASGSSRQGRERDGTYSEGWECWRKGLGGEVICRAG